MAVEDHLSRVWSNIAHCGCHHPLGRSSLTARIGKLSWTQAGKRARQKCIPSACSSQLLWCDQLLKLLQSWLSSIAWNRETNPSSSTFLARVLYHCNGPEMGMSNQSFLQLWANAKCLCQTKIPTVVRMHRNNMIRQKHVGRRTEIA